MITRKEIGKRVSAARRERELTQEELAKILGIPRTAVTQLEAGRRDLSAIELQRLAYALNLSIDTLLADSYEADAVKEPEEAYALTTARELATERISEPIFNPEKFRNILLYIFGKCSGKPNVGDTLICKLLYFCDFDYYEIYEEHLTGARYRKMAYGPVPEEMSATIKEMSAKGEIQKIKTEFFGKPQTRYLPLIKTNLRTFSAAEKEVVDSVIERMSDWTAMMITDYSHNDKPWRATEMNRYIDYELVFYRRPPYSVRIYEEDEQDII
jgi:transcriptional regulator with XRE-family HTH domain